MSNNAASNSSAHRDRTNDESAPLLTASAAAPATSYTATATVQPPSKSPTPLNRSSNSALLSEILKLTGPISCTTVVEFLPQVLIAAMVGHANPWTALPPYSDDDEALLMGSYGLANLVYSTAAFSLCYGMVCGLDSVAAASFGMTLQDECTGRETPIHEVVEGTSEFNVAPAPAAHAASIPTRTIQWNSPALRGMYVVTPRHSRANSRIGAGMMNGHIVLPASNGPKGGTPGRFDSHAVSTTTLRRSPSMPTNLMLSHDLDNSLPKLTERSEFGSWKRRPDEGIDAPDTPEGGEHDEEKDEETIRKIKESLASQPIMITHPTATHSTHLLDRPSIHHSASVPHIKSVSLSSTPLAHTNLPQHHPMHTFHPLLFQQLSINSINSHTNGNTTNMLSPHANPSPTTPTFSSSQITSPFPLSPTPQASPMNGYHYATTANGGSTEITPTKLPASATRSITVSPQNVSINDIPPSAAAPPSSLIGIWIKRCLMLEMIVVTVLIVTLYFGCEPFLYLIGEPREAIDIASSYVTAASFGLPFVAIYHSLNKGLQSSGIVFPVFIITFVAKFLSVIAIYVGLFHLKMQLVGIAWILTVSIAIQAAAVYLYMSYSGIVALWWGTDLNQYLLDSPSTAPSRSICTRLQCWLVDYWYGLYDYATLAIPACAAICLEYWLFDILGALSGLLPNAPVELSVHMLLYTSCLGSYMIFSGLSISVSVVVGQKLGRPGESWNARQAAIVGTISCLSVSACLVVALIYGHNYLGRCLTSQYVILTRFNECIPILIIYQMVDGLNTCSTQLLRTLGVQKYGVALHFVMYYAIGMSTGYYLAFEHHLGVYGLWIGLTIGVGLNALIATIWLSCLADWDQQCQQAIERTDKMNSSESTTSLSSAASSSSQRPSRANYRSTSDRHDDRSTTVASMRAENMAQHGV